MRRFVVLSLALVCLLVGAVFWRDGESARARPPASEELNRPDTATVVEQPQQSQLEQINAANNNAETKPETFFGGPREDYGELRRLRGKVVWYEGTPVSWAHVDLLSSPFDGFTQLALGDSGEVFSQSKADEDGRFQLDWVAGGMWELTVRMGDDQTTVIQVPPLADEITVVIQRATTILEVVVVDEATGDPIADAGVRAYRGTRCWNPVWTTADGLATFRGTSGGPVRVSVQPRDGEWITDYFIECKAGEVTRARIPIGRGLTVRGTIVADDSGTPVVGAQLILGLRFDPSRYGPKTDSKGRFVWDSLPWDPNTRRTLSVNADGFAPWQGQIGHPKNDGGEQVFEIRLLRPATVRLRCLNADGSPREGVLAIARSDRLIPEARVVAADVEAGRTDANGRVTFAKLAPGDGGKVTCWVKGAIALEVPFAAIAASEVRDLGDVIIHDPRALEGIVRTATGEPATGAFVVLEKHNDEDEDYGALASALIAPRFGARVAADGHFRIRGVQPGTWDLLVHGGGHPRLLRVAIPISETGTIPELKLRLPQPVSLRGRVVDPGGRGVPNLEVAYMRSHPVAANLMESVRTDAEGRFEIGGFTREDESVPLYVRSERRKVTPRDGPVEIRVE